MELQTFEDEKEVLIKLPQDTKLQGTIKDGIIKVYIDSRSVEYKYPDKFQVMVSGDKPKPALNKRKPLPPPPPLARTIKGEVKK